MKPDELYAEYLNERQGISSIWVDEGFVTYRITGKECFLADMFITRAHRKSGLCRKLIEQLSEIAVGSGCDVITANIHLELPGADYTLRAAQSLGFKIERANNNILLIALQIEGS